MGGKKIKGPRTRNLIVIMLLNGRKDKNNLVALLNKQSAQNSYSNFCWEFQTYIHNLNDVMKGYINPFSYKSYNIMQSFIRWMMNYGTNRDILFRNIAHQEKFQMETFFSSPHFQIMQFTLWLIALLSNGTLNWTKLLKNLFFFQKVSEPPASLITSKDHIEHWRWFEVITRLLLAK